MAGEGEGDLKGEVIRTSGARVVKGHVLFGGVRESGAGAFRVMPGRGGGSMVSVVCGLVDEVVG